LIKTTKFAEKKKKSKESIIFIDPPNTLFQRTDHIKQAAKTIMNYTSLIVMEKY